MVRTLDALNGSIKIISTSDYADLVRDIINDLDARGVTAKIIKEGPWEGVL